MELIENKAIANNRIKTFRWYFYIALMQFLLYFIVPLVVFPSKVAIDIEVISALTLGIPVGIFFMIVNIMGLYLDESRRVLYISILSLITLYFIWVIISWAFIEKMTYLLR